MTCRIHAGQSAPSVRPKPHYGAFGNEGLGRDLSGSLQGAGGIGGLLTAQLYNPTTSNSTTVLYTYCANGNVSELVDTTGTNIVAHHEYSPFGEAVVATGPLAEVNVILFSTKYWDVETEVGYWGYRCFENGRSMSRDPIGEDGGINVYCFVWNDPVNLFDSLGLSGIGWNGGGGGGTISGGGACCGDPCRIRNLHLYYHDPPVVMLNATWSQSGDCQHVKLQFWTCTWQGGANRRRRGEIGLPSDGRYDYLPPPGEGNAPGAWRDGDMSSDSGAGNIRYSAGGTIAFKARVTADSCEDGHLEPVDPVESGTGHILIETINGKMQVVQSDVPWR